MTHKEQTMQLAAAYCPSCHLATRADRERCIHCGRPRNTPLPEAGVQDGRIGRAG